MAMKLKILRLIFFVPCLALAPIFSAGCRRSPAPKPESPAPICSLDPSFLDPVMKDKSGVVLLLDARSGRKILDYEKELKSDDILPIGSLFKLVTALWALKSRKVNPESVFQCRGELVVGDTRLGCWTARGHGPVDMIRAIAVSCNLYFYRLGFSLKPSEILAEAKKLGLNNTRFSTVEELKEAAMGYEVRGRNASWAAGADPGVSGSPEQVAGLIQHMALGTENDEIESLKWIRKGMKLAVREGTAHELDNFYPPVAGKTGTGFKKITAPGYGWFGGFVPADNPSLVVVVVMYPGKGEKDAVPVARKVLEQVWEQCPAMLRTR